MLSLNANYKCKLTLFCEVTSVLPDLSLITTKQTWDYHEWMNECLTTPQHEKQIDYWVSEWDKCMKWLLRVLRHNTCALSGLELITLWGMCKHKSHFKIGYVLLIITQYYNRALQDDVVYCGSPLIDNTSHSRLWKKSQPCLYPTLMLPCTEVCF